MADAMRAILTDYDETLEPIHTVVKRHGISWGKFRRALEQHPEMQSEYERIQHWRGERYSEKAIEVGTELDTPKDLVRTREVAAQVYERAASRYNKRFNPRVTVEHEVGPNILGAMADAERRSLPGRNLGQIVDASYSTVSALIEAQAADLGSAAAPSDDDPFAD